MRFIDNKIVLFYVSFYLFINTLTNQISVFLPKGLSGNSYAASAQQFIRENAP